MARAKGSAKTPGSGRKKGSTNKASAKREAEIAKSGLMPLDYMLNLLRDKDSTEEQKTWAAKEAAPYCHPKLAAVFKSGPEGGPIPHEHRLDPVLHELLERIVGRSASNQG